MLYNAKKSTSVGSTHAQRRLVFVRISKTLYSIDEIESIYSLNIEKVVAYRQHHNFLPYEKLLRSMVRGETSQF